jgi:Skp family chaperone for outer membrane proteins
MFKKIFAVSCSVLLLASCSHHSNKKDIATINIKELAQTSYCKDPILALQKKYQPQFKNLESKAKKLEKNKANHLKLEKIENELRTLSQKAQSESQQLEQNCINGIKDGAKQVAQNRGYELVVPSQIAIYSDKDSNITNEVKTILLDKNKK